MLQDKVPSYLLGKSQLVTTVTFTVLFAVVALVVSMPFVHNVWFQLNSPLLFAGTLGFCSVVVLLLSLSKRVMYRFRAHLNWLQVIAWILGEIVLVAGLYTVVTFKGSQAGIIELVSGDSGTLFGTSLLFCAVVLGVPQALAAQYFAIQDRDNTIRLMNYGSVVSDAEPVPQEEKIITLFDNDGVLKFSVRERNLYYFESDDNYIKVWYSDSKGAIRQYMLRCRLKTIEDSFSGSDLVRCHRKYIVNISRVEVLSKQKDGYCVDLGLDSVEPIPVSKTYEETVLARFNSR